MFYVQLQPEHLQVRGVFGVCKVVGADLLESELDKIGEKWVQL